MGQATSYPVNLQSLSITIREEQWVHRILREEGAPLSPKEIVRRLSEIFGVGIGAIQALTIIDGTDPLVGQLRDGRLLLRAWINAWQERLTKCDEILVKCRDLRRQISGSRDDLKANQEQLQLLDETLAGKVAAENDLSRKISELRECVGTCESDYASSLEGVSATESGLLCLEKRTRGLARLRTAALASYSLAAFCLLVRTRSAVPIFCVVASSVASLGIWRLLSSARKKSLVKREQLLATRTRAIEAAARLEKAQRQLAIAQTEYTAVVQSRDGLTIEREALRLKIRESSEALSAIETELGRFHESSVVEERARLLQLLGACTEVEHVRQG
jgi:hypothetical protein